MTTAVVFDMEDARGPMPLGVYERTDEDVVIYLTSHAGYRAAPADCVKVVDVDVCAPVAQLSPGYSVRV